MKMNLNWIGLYGAIHIENNGTFIAIKAIEIWAENEISFAASPSTRYNTAASGYFSFEFVQLFNHPQVNSIHFEYTTIFMINETIYEFKFNELLSNIDIFHI